MRLATRLVSLNGTVLKTSFTGGRTVRVTRQSRAPAGVLVPIITVYDKTHPLMGLPELGAC
jgi:hypothetical protein